MMMTTTTTAVVLSHRSSLVATTATTRARTNGRAARNVLLLKAKAGRENQLMASSSSSSSVGRRRTKNTTRRAITDWMDLSDVDMNDEDDEEEEEDEEEESSAATTEEEEDVVLAQAKKDEEEATMKTEQEKKKKKANAAEKGKKKMKKKKKMKSASSGSSLLLFSGGTAMNGVCDALRDYTTSVTHVLPVSDDGGSTSEIIRVSGGPAVGDIRSRCLRLSDESTREAIAVKELLAHRLHPTDEELAKNEWYKIQEGDSPLWDGIDNAYATIIRRFLVHFHTEVTTNTHKERFSFVNGSIGNFFFAGARMFFRSMEAAIFLYARVSKLPRETMVVPCIECEDNERVTINAELMDGTILRGQNDISHPSVDKKSFTKQFHVDDGRREVPSVFSKEFWSNIIEAGEFPEIEGKEFWGGIPKSTDGHERVRDALADGNLSSASELIQSRLVDLTLRPLSVWDVDKAVTASEKLDSSIKRIYYATGDGSDSASNEIGEIFPRANKTMLKQLETSDCIIYGMGSLYTSIVPNLILRGVGETIAGRDCPKILLFNGSIDRETSGMTSADYIFAIVDALNRKHTEYAVDFHVSDYVTHILTPDGGQFIIDDDALKAASLTPDKVRVVESTFTKKKKEKTANGRYAPSELVKAVSAVVDETKKKKKNVLNDDDDDSSSLAKVAAAAAALNVAPPEAEDGNDAEASVSSPR